MRLPPLQPRTQYSRHSKSSQQHLPSIDNTIFLPIDERRDRHGNRGNLKNRRSGRGGQPKVKQRSSKEWPMMGLVSDSLAPLKLRSQTECRERRPEKKTRRDSALEATSRFFRVTVQNETLPQDPSRRSKIAIFARVVFLAFSWNKRSKARNHWTD